MVYYSLRKRHMGQCLREIRYKLPGFSLSIVTQEAVIPPAMSVTNVKCCQPMKLLRSSATSVFGGDGHVGTFCLACTKMTDSQKKSRNSA